MTYKPCIADAVFSTKIRYLMTPNLLPLNAAKNGDRFKYNSIIHPKMEMRINERLNPICH
jgi:hypothetical protein